MNKNSRLKDLIGKRVEGKKIDSPTSEEYVKAAEKVNEELRRRPSPLSGYNPNEKFKQTMELA